MMKTRIVQKKAKNGNKAWLLLLVLVILAGVGVGTYIYKPIDLDWLTKDDSKKVNTAEQKKQVVTPLLIQKVSVAEIDSITGLSKLDSQAKSFFDLMNNLELKPQKQFSYNDWFAALKTQVNPDEATYSYLASLLYETTVKSGFQVGERHLHQQLPDYALQGFDVYVKPGSNGLTLYNPQEVSAIVTITYSEQGFPVLTLSADPKADWKPIEGGHIKSTRYQQAQVEITDQALAIGSTAVRSQGKEGLLVEVFVGSETLSRDFYLPEPAIIGRGPIPEEKQQDKNEQIAG